MRGASLVFVFGPYLGFESDRVIINISLTPLTLILCLYLCLSDV